MSQHLSLHILGDPKRSDREKARKRTKDSEATGLWATWDKAISYWTLAAEPLPELGSLVTWADYCETYRLPESVGLGVPWDVYSMSYVPIAE